jgi:phosphoglycerate dehydrogenase-like enzyme
MNIALLQIQLTLQEINQLIKEFPQFLFVTFTESAMKGLTKEHWDHIEIVFGGKLAAQDLANAHQLSWIHTPTASVSRLCLPEIESQGNILVSNTREENVVQIGEFVLGAILASTKNLFEWDELKATPHQVWDSKLRHTMMSIKDRILLQVGMDKIGTEIARKAKLNGMKVWGMDRHASFHPHCEELFSLNQIDFALRYADVVVITLPPGREFEGWFGPEQFHFMKEGAILIVIGSKKVLDEKALINPDLTAKLRAIFIDAPHQTPIPPASKLWSVPNLTITPEIAPRPKSIERDAYRLFRFNLRQYIHGNFSDMKNLIDPALAVSSEEEEVF